MGKKVYQVKVSSACTVGVFTSMKKAYEEAMIHVAPGKMDIYTTINAFGNVREMRKKVTYSNFCKVMNEKGYVSFELPASSFDDLHVEVAMFKLNAGSM